MTVTPDLGPAETKKRYTLIHTLPFEELRSRALAGETFISREGYPVCTRDRKWDERTALDLWMRDLDHVNKQRRLEAEPKEVSVQDDPRPLNKKGRPFSWSHSAKSKFEQCPKAYAHDKFYCDTPWIETDAIEYGNKVHEAAENFLKGLKYDTDTAAPIKQYLELFQKNAAAGYEVIPELEIVLDRNMKPLRGSKAWFSKAAWFRAKLDVVVIKDGRASYFDWKTGARVKADEEQLKTCLAALSILRPEVTTFAGKLIWTKHGKVTGLQSGDLSRDDLKNIWAGILPGVQRMEDAWRSELWQGRPSGLCKWRGGVAKGGGQCAAYDKCEYHK